MRVDTNRCWVTRARAKICRPTVPHLQPDTRFAKQETTTTALKWIAELADVSDSVCTKCSSPTLPLEQGRVVNSTPGGPRLTSHQPPVSLRHSVHGNCVRCILHIVTVVLEQANSASRICKVQLERASLTLFCILQVLPQIRQPKKSLSRLLWLLTSASQQNWWLPWAN